VAAKSEREYQGWRIRITGTPVGIGSSAMIEVWEPGHDPHSDTGVIVPFTKRVPSETEALAVAFQAAKKWIHRQAKPTIPREPKGK
jgi:hypothetical protein